MATMLIHNKDFKMVFFITNNQKEMILDIQQHDYMLHQICANDNLGLTFDLSEKLSSWLLDASVSGKILKTAFFKSYSSLLYDIQPIYFTDQEHGDLQD